SRERAEHDGFERIGKAEVGADGAEQGPESAVVSEILQGRERGSPQLEGMEGNPQLLEASNDAFLGLAGACVHFVTGRAHLGQKRAPKVQERAGNAARNQNAHRIGRQEWWVFRASRPGSA